MGYLPKNEMNEDTRVNIRSKEINTDLKLRQDILQRMSSINTAINTKPKIRVKTKASTKAAVMSECGSPIINGVYQIRNTNLKVIDDKIKELEGDNHKKINKDIKKHMQEYRVRDAVLQDQKNQQKQRERLRKQLLRELINQNQDNKNER